MATPTYDDAIDREFLHEHVEVFTDPATGLRGVIAIHSTHLGPAAGGLRLARYDTLQDAILDALRLSRAMTSKNAAAGLDLGGGKAVLVDDGGWADPADRSERMRAFGRILDRLGGRYYTAEDVGTSPADMEDIASVTPYVGGRPGGQGDPSAATARTVCAAIADACEIHLGRPLASVHVGILGAGHVGAHLATLLTVAGARVSVTDIAPSRAEDVARATGAQAVALDGFLLGDHDVLAPCALGGAIAERDVAGLRCRIVAGAANNPLASGDVERLLAERGIVYVPDFLANCGGIIHIAADILGFDPAAVDERIADATARTRELLAESRLGGRRPAELARALVAERLAGTRAVGVGV